MAFLDFFLPFVRPFQADDKVIRPFNAHPTLRIRSATDLTLNGGPRTFLLQTRRDGLLRDGPQSLFRIRKLWLVAAVRQTSRRPLLRKCLLGTENLHQ